MSKNNNSKSKSKSKSKTKSQQNEQENVGFDMWQNLLNNPTPNQHFNSFTQQTPNPGFGFSNFAQHPNSFNQQTGWYTNPQIPPCDWSPNTYYGTTSANPQGYQQAPSRFSQNILESSDETEPGSELEPETQPDPETESDPKKKKGKKTKPAAKRVQVKWTDDEARVLAERWVHCSENGIIGNNQTNESFWKNVHSGYNSVVEKTRNLNSITGKWNKISHDVKSFEGIHRKFRETGHQSGAGDNDVLNAAKKGFFQQVGRKFIYESCWDVLRHYPKFFTEQGVMSNKRAFQAEPETVDLGENDNPTETTLEANMRTLFRDDLIRRPMGRKATKTSQSSDAGSSSRGSISSERLEALEAVKANALKSTETLEVIKKNNIKKAMFKALSFLSKSLPKRATKKELKLLKLARKEVVEEYQNVYDMNASDEDENENDDANEDEESSSD